MRAWLIGLLVLGTVATACGEDTPLDYTLEVRSDFLAACTDPETDSLLTARLCVCIFEEAQASWDFDRFVSLEERVALDIEGVNDLPLPIAQVVANCVISEAEL